MHVIQDEYHGARFADVAQERCDDVEELRPVGPGDRGRIVLGQPGEQGGGNGGDLSAVVSDMTLERRWGGGLDQVVEHFCERREWIGEGLGALAVPDECPGAAPRATPPPPPAGPAA